jgi:hypothetical protein
VQANHRHPTARLRRRSRSFSAAAGVFLSLFALLGPPLQAQERRPAEQSPPRTRVFGRVVDEAGRAVAGASIELHSVDGPWCAGDERRKLDTKTREDGAFEVEAPVPTADWISLTVRPAPYLDLAGRDFGPAGGRDQPRLVAGDNDLGEFRLASTGAIAGRVVGPAATPIANAQVRLDGSFPGGRGRSARTDEHGDFVVGHVPPGAYGLEVLADGYLLAKLEPLTVKACETVRSREVALVAAPTISGVVVDSDGAPVADARVWAWPSGSGTGAGARSDASGRFLVALKHEVPHRFEVAAPGFAKLEEPFRTEHAVGADDVRLVLQRPVMTTFVVLDARTSQPVTRYALTLNWRSRGGSSRSGGEPSHPLGERAGGELVCEAHPEFHLYRITAPGYALAEGEIVFDAPNSRRCVVRLGPEGSLRGRVRLRGAPIRAEIKLYAGSLLRRHEEDNGSSASYDEQGWFWCDWEGQRDLVFQLPQPTKHWTAADGSFEIAGLPSGEYRLEINGPDGARLSLDPVAVFEGEAPDLGELELIPSASLAGAVLLPAGVDPSKVKLHAYSWDTVTRTQVRADATFLFEHVPAGIARVGVTEAEGLVTWGKHPSVVLEPGSTGQLTLDLTDRASVATSVTVRVNGKPAEGVRVALRSAEGQREEHLGETGANGIARRSVLALGSTNVHLRAQSGMRLPTFERALEIRVGAKPEATLEIACGALEVEWPALRADEPLYLVRLSAFADSDEKRLSAHAMPQFDAPRNDARIVGPRRARFDFVPPGEIEWTIHVQTVEGNEVKSNHTFRRTLDVRAATTAECVLTESDRVKP